MSSVLQPDIAGGWKRVAQRRQRARVWSSWLLRRRLLLVMTAANVYFRPAIAHAQLFAHRTLIAVPLDDSSKATGLLPTLSYYAEIERGMHSAGDDRAWSARLAGTIELWRVTPRSSIIISAADELVANSLKDYGFNPRGITWELSIGAAHRFDNVTAQLDFGHYCKHSIDTIDPPGAEYYVPNFVPTQRTASLWGPRLALISRELRAGRRVRFRASVAGERYQNQFDGREPADTSIAKAGSISWSNARASAFGAVRVDVQASSETSFYLRTSGRTVFFASPQQDASSTVSRATLSRSNYRGELGWRARGGAGAVELYGALENVFDDLDTITPRPSRELGFGLRLSDLRHF